MAFPDLDFLLDLQLPQNLRLHLPNRHRHSTFFCMPLKGGLVRYVISTLAYTLSGSGMP